MKRIPKDPGPGGLSGLLREGYRFGRDRFARLESDIFSTRLMFQPVLCIRGESAARMFYEERAFTRKAALPPTTLMLLQDYRSVNRLDGEAHRHRKQMFVGLMSEESVRNLCELTRREWAERFERDDVAGEINLHEEACRILCEAVLKWVGIRPTSHENGSWSEELSAMIDGAGSIGWRCWKGLVLRGRAERRARGLIRRVRNGWVPRTDPSPLESIALFRDQGGEFLPVKTAAVELINVLRPVVAVGRYITFAALALHHHPDCRKRIASGDETYTDYFIQEVRRYYPFFPMVAGRAMESFDWQGYRINKGALVLLDLHATNHDPRLWEHPERFDPMRFSLWDHGRFNLIPQGAGDIRRGHRCPGEAITISLIRMAVRSLCMSMNYEVPPQDLRIPCNRFPTRPSSGFVIRMLPEGARPLQPES